MVAKRAMASDFFELLILKLGDTKEVARLLIKVKE